MRLMPTSRIGRAGLDHVRGDQARAADGRNENIRATAVRREIVRLTVTNRDGGVFVEQQHCNWLADDVTAADDHCILSRDRQAASLENLNHPCWSTRCKRGLTRLDFSYIYGMKAVDVLCRTHGFEQQLGVHLCRKRKLDEDAVNVLTSVQRGNQRQHLFGGNGLRWSDELAEEAEFGAGLHLAANINLRCRDVADQDRRKAGANALYGERGYVGSDFGLD